jgi:hypothetical protein
LAQFAKKKQRQTLAATRAKRPRAERARPRIIPHPVRGTIEFERGQIVAKVRAGALVSAWFGLCIALRASSTLGDPSRSLARIGDTKHKGRDFARPFSLEEKAKRVAQAAFL